MTGPAHEALVGEVAAVLAEHRAVFQCDGDYGEMQWVECTCGDEYFIDTDAGYAEHEAHLAAALADLLADRERRVGAEALREAAADLREKAWLRFDEFGPLDTRGAAIWDCAAFLTEDLAERIEERP